MVSRKHCETAEDLQCNISIVSKYIVTQKGTQFLIHTWDFKSASSLTDSCTMKYKKKKKGFKRAQKGVKYKKETVKG